MITKLSASLLLLSASCFALTTTWNGSSNNQFSVSANWSNGIPGTSDTGIFNSSGTVVQLQNGPIFTGTIDVNSQLTLLGQTTFNVDVLRINAPLIYSTSGFKIQPLTFTGPNQKFIVNDTCSLINTYIINNDTSYSVTGTGSIDLQGSFLVAPGDTRKLTIDGVSISTSRYAPPGAPIFRAGALGADPDSPILSKIDAKDAKFYAINGTGCQLFNSTILVGTNTRIEAARGNSIGPARVDLTNSQIINNGYMVFNGLNFDSPSQETSYLRSGSYSGNGTVQIFGTVNISAPFSCGSLFIGDESTAAQADIKKVQAQVAQLQASVQSLVSSLSAQIKSVTAALKKIKVAIDKVRRLDGILHESYAPYGLEFIGNLSVEKDGEITAQVAPGATSIIFIDSTLRLGLDGTGSGPVSLTIVPADDFNLPSNDLAYKVISYNNTEVEGSFGTITIAPELGSFDIISNSSGIYLLSKTNTFETIASNKNNAHLGSMLNSLLKDPTTNSCLESKIESMLFMPADEINSIMTQMQPASFKNQQIVLEEMMFNINDETSETLYNFYSGFRPSLYGGYNRMVQHGFSQYSGYRASNGYQMLSLTYGHNSWQLLGGLGSLQSAVSNKKAYTKTSDTSILGTLGASYFSKNFEVGLDGLFSYHFIDTQRKIPDFDAKALSSHGGYSLKAQGHIAYVKTIDNTRFKPYDDLSYLFTHENSFHEHGADCLDLHVESSRRSVLRNAIGLRCDLAVNAIISPFIDLAYIYEYRFEGQGYKYQFTNTNQTTSDLGLRAPQNLAKVALGLYRSQGLWDYQLKFTGWYGKRYSDSGVHLVIDRRF